MRYTDGDTEDLSRKDVIEIMDCYPGDVWSITQAEARSHRGAPASPLFSVLQIRGKGRGVMYVVQKVFDLAKHE